MATFEDDGHRVMERLTLPPSSPVDNISNAQPYNITIPTQMDWGYTAIEIAVAGIATLGNLLVIIVFIKFDTLRSVTNYYVISLATADLLVGVIGIPCAITVSVGLPQNFHACIFMNSLLLLLCTSSILSLVAVTIDRLVAILQPLRYQTTMTRKRALVIIGVCWTLASLIGLLPTMGWNKGRPPVPSCFFMQVMDLRYLVFIYFSTIVGPSIFMAYVYSLIFKVVRHQIRRLSSQMLPQDCESRKRIRSQGQAAQSIAIIVVLFVISWIPLYTINSVFHFCKHCHVPLWILKCCIILSHLNSAWNPILYAWGMRDFREGLRRLFHLGRQRNTSASLVYNGSLKRSSFV